MKDLVLRVYVVGPKGGLRARNTFRGKESEALRKCLADILSKREDGADGDGKKCATESKLEAAMSKSHHSLRRRVLKSGMVRWTCRKCKRCIDSVPGSSEFQANLSMIVDHGLGDGRSWIAGRKGEKPVGRTGADPVCVETRAERAELNKSFRQ